MRRRDLALACVLAALALPACAERAPQAVLERDTTVAEVALPAPEPAAGVTLDDALARRRSARAFSDDPVDLATIAGLLWAAQGVTSPDGGRTAPSAGALYPLEVYALTDATLWHYVPAGHRAQRRDAPPWRDRLRAAARDQEVVGRAPVVLVITGVDARTTTKYGPNAESFVDREAGHAAQNVLLHATAHGLAAVPVGGFDPDAVATVLLLAPGEVPRYLIPVGHPA
jgi:SagB-type dehydrogenase family enzyme